MQEAPLHRRGATFSFSSWEFKIRILVREKIDGVQAKCEKLLWLFSRRADYWLACGGASSGLLAGILLFLLLGDREIDAMDFVLSEFHLGATYDAIIRRRIWNHRRVDVLLIPLVILTLTYAFSLGG